MVSQPSVPFLASFRQSWRRRVNAHFKFELDGRPIAYCYIRKNASSAFKRMMLDMHGYDGPWSGAFAFMKQNCGVGSVEDVRSASWRVYVYRDPFERAASLFRNKLVMQKDADDLLANFVRVMHSDPEDATFTEFVRWYLPAKYADPHVWAQSDHLLPVDYNCAWSMAWLQDHAREIFGGEIADRYFLKPANQSSEHLFNDPSEDVPVRELRQHYDRTGELPGVRALRNNETSRMIHDLYERDYELESAVQKSEPALA
jgi:hypothetical protein